MKEKNMRMSAGILFIVFGFFWLFKTIADDWYVAYERTIYFLILARDGIRWGYALGILFGCILTAAGCFISKPYISIGGIGIMVITNLVHTVVDLANLDDFWYLFSRDRSTNHFVVILLCLLMLIICLQMIVVLFLRKDAHFLGVGAAATILIRFCILNFSFSNYYSELQVEFIYILLMVFVLAASFLLLFKMKEPWVPFIPAAFTVLLNIINFFTADYFSFSLFTLSITMMNAAILLGFGWQGVPKKAGVPSPYQPGPYAQMPEQQYARPAVPPYPQQAGPVSQYQQPQYAPPAQPQYAQPPAQAPVYQPPQYNAPANNSYEPPYAAPVNPQENAVPHTPGRRTSYRAAARAAQMSSDSAENE